MPDLPPINKWPAQNAIGAVHIIHGMAEHPGRYADFAASLNAAGFTVWAHHQRGHGDNPLPGILGHFADHDGWRLLIDDAWAVSNQLKHETGLPLVMFAHSMGSFVGQGVIAEHGASYHGVIFTGTNGPPSSIEQQGHVVAQWQVQALGPGNPGLWLFHIVFDTFNAAFGLGAPPNTWLSRDKSEVKKYTDDCKCGFPLTSQAWLDLSDGRLTQASVEFFKKYPKDVPIHILVGTADPVGERGAGVRRLLDILGRAGLTSVSSQLYPDARHELIHETNRDDIIRDIVAWLVAKTRAAVLPKS